MNVTAKTSIWGKIMKGGVKSIITCIHGLCWMSGILPLFAPVLFETLWNPIFNLFDCQVPHGHPMDFWFNCFCIMSGALGLSLVMNAFGLNKFSPVAVAATITALAWYKASVGQVLGCYAIFIVSFFFLILHVVALKILNYDNLHDDYNRGRRKSNV